MCSNVQVHMQIWRMEDDISVNITDAVIVCGKDVFICKRTEQMLYKLQATSNRTGIATIGKTTGPGKKKEYGRGKVRRGIFLGNWPDK